MVSATHNSLGSKYVKNFSTLKLLFTIYLLKRNAVLLQRQFAMNIPTSARLTKERPMQRPMSPPILEIKDSGDISCNFKTIIN